MRLRLSFHFICSLTACDISLFVRTVGIFIIPFSRTLTLRPESSTIPPIAAPVVMVFGGGFVKVGDWLDADKAGQRVFLESVISESHSLIVPPLIIGLAE